MEKLMFLKLSLILCGALALVQSVNAEQRNNFVCTAKQIYFLDSEGDGQLYIPPNNYVVGKKFVIDRFTGEAQGSLLNTTNRLWTIVINSTGNNNGDWNPSFTYHGQPSDIEIGEALWPQIVRHNMTLALNLTYTGPDEMYRKLDEGKKVTFLLSDSGSVTTGICNLL